MQKEITRVGQPYFSESDIDEINSNIAAVLRSGWLTTGRYAEALERRFSSLVGTRYAIAVSSGTAALHTIMAAIDLKGGEVVVPANTFASSANAALYVGARVKLADCDINTFNVTAETLEESITQKTRAAMVTHMCGNPCEMREIVKLCANRGIMLIEDAAHAVGSKYRDKACGSFGLASAFSLYPTKVVTSAEGGLISTDSKEVNTFARTFRNVGRDAVGHGPIRLLGYNYRMSDIHATIGLNQVDHLEEFIVKRNKLAKVYNEYIAKIDWIAPQHVPRHSLSSYYAYNVRLLRRTPSRDKVMERLRTRGIETTVMFRPIHQQPYSKGRIAAPRNLRSAELLGATSLVLPLHARMTEEQVEDVVKELKGAS